MAGKAAVLPDGIRMSDLMSVMVLARVFPMDHVKSVLADTGKTSLRERNLPAYVMVYFVIALWLYRQASYQEVLRCIFESFNWVASRPDRVTISCKAAIAQARTRVGSRPLQQLCSELVKPIATKQTIGAHWRDWRVVSLDGSTLDVGDTTANAAEFGRPGVSRGDGSAYPQLRLCSLVENGSHVLFGTAIGPYSASETTLAAEVVTHLAPGMICIADRGFYGFELWRTALQTGADLLWRVKRNMLLRCDKRLADGSYLSTIYPTTKDRRNDQRGVTVRVVEYTLTNGSDAEGEDIYRLITTILDHDRAPAVEMAQLYAQRWEIETTFGEFKTRLGGRDLVLRSKTPDGVRQEFWGFILAHHAIRSIMHDAAEKAQVPPNRLSYSHSLEEIRRKLPLFLVVPPSEVESSL
jgi:hypothetical protein